MTPEAPLVWHARLDKARKVRDQVWAPGARAHVARYAGGPTPSLAEMLQGTVQANLAFPYLKALVASLAAQDPQFLLEPQYEASEREVETDQYLVNYFWRELGLKASMKAVLLDALLTGWGWMEYGYQAEFGVEGEPPQVAVATAASLGQRLVQAVSSLVTGGTSRERQTAQGHVIEFNEYIKKESLFARRVSPFRLLVPWDVHDPEEWPWLGYDLWVDRADIAHWPGIDAAAVRALPSPAQRSTGSAITGAEGLGISSVGPAGLPFTDRVRVSKVWDKRSQTRLLLASPGSAFLTTPLKWPYEFEGFPMAGLIFHAVPETDEDPHVFPLSVLAAAAPVLDEMTKCLTHLAENRKRFHTKVLVDASLDDGIKQKLADPALGGFVEIKGLANQPNLIRELSFTPSAQPLQQEFQVLTQLLEIIISLNLINATSAPGVDTATEANLLSQGLMAKLREMQETLETYACDGARRLAGMFNFLDQEIVFKITGDSARAGEWVRRKPSDIRGEYAYRCHAGSMSPPREMAIARKQLIDVFNILVSPQAQGKTSADIDLLLKQIARTFTEIKDVDRLFATGLTEERAAAQAENQLLLQNMPQVVSPRDNHLIHTEVHAPLGQTPDDLTPAAAQHLTDHAQYLQGAASAPGSSAPRPLAAGSAGFPDILQGTRNAGKGTGAETNEKGLGA